MFNRSDLNDLKRKPAAIRLITYERCQFLILNDNLCPTSKTHTPLQHREGLQVDVASWDLQRSTMYKHTRNAHCTTNTVSLFLLRSLEA
jgi:hypothetical protein